MAEGEGRKPHPADFLPNGSEEDVFGLAVVNHRRSFSVCREAWVRDTDVCLDPDPRPHKASHAKPTCRLLAGIPTQIQSTLH